MKAFHMIPSIFTYCTDINKILPLFPHYTFQFFAIYILNTFHW
ncbi:hypothetical protein BMB171_C0682 [Bacillus thuringiensis BMB171]|nr:hypothetical protein BMB171_C0682 [Bacillus thuringiensis BMB171]